MAKTATTKKSTYQKGDKQNSAYQFLRSAIIENQFEVNHPLTEKEISTMLDGMSRTPIRDALMRLEADGLVERIPGKGLFVSKLSIKDLLEITEIRFPLEATAIRLFTERANEQLKQELREMIDRHERCHIEGDNVAAVQCDNEFHFSIAKGSMNQRLYKIINKQIEENSRGAFMTQRDSDRVEMSIVQHKEIFDAIMEGDGNKAAERMSAHLQNWMDYIKELQFKSYYLFDQ